MASALSAVAHVHGEAEIKRDPAGMAKAHKYVFDRLADGRFVPKIAKTFPFEQTAEAYRYLESNQQVGKVVITVP